MTRTSYLFAQKQNITANKKRVVNFRFNFPFIDPMDLSCPALQIYRNNEATEVETTQRVWKIFIESRAHTLVIDFCARPGLACLMMVHLQTILERVCVSKEIEELSSKAH